jgi:membrane fusion protein (multidrug efflux system)
MNRVAKFLVCIALIAPVAGCGRGPSAAQRDHRPIVAVITPQRGAAVRSISLPGDLVGLYESTLFSKVTGYLKGISVDKGDWVKRGQVLAEIEVPELQQRFERAQADLEVQRLTYQRLEQVWKSDPRLVARQDVDIAQGKYRAGKAQVDELGALVGYTRIVAPYDGVITGRFVDPGALIKAGGTQNTAGPSEGSSHPGGTATPVLSMARIDIMRIYVYAPQGVVGLIKRGTPATLTLQDGSGKSYSGEVTRFASSLDLSTRTMLAEIDIPNPHHELYPGMYANVTLQLERHADAIRLPNSAVANDERGDGYVLVARKGVLAKVRVDTGINDGHYIEITRGLAGNEQVVASVNPSLSAGEQVVAVAAPALSVKPARVADNNQ